MNTTGFCLCFFIAVFLASWPIGSDRVAIGCCVCGRCLHLCHQKYIYIIHGAHYHIECRTHCTRCDARKTTTYTIRSVASIAYYDNNCSRAHPPIAIRRKLTHDDDRNEKNKRNAKNAAPCCFTLNFMHIIQNANSLWKTNPRD